MTHEHESDLRPASVDVATLDRRERVHLGLLRLAARTGRTRRATIALGALLGSSTVPVQVAPGVTLDISLDDPYWARIALGHDYEPEVRWALDELVGPDVCVIDAGANIGYWSSIVAARTSAIAVEPNPTLLPALTDHGRRHGFTVIPAAVWDEDGVEVEFVWSPRRHGAGGIGNDGSHRSCVTTVTVDRLYRDHGAGATPVLKLDVEGAEIRALHGATEVLRRGWVIYEEHGRDVEHRVTRWLVERGAEIFVLDPGRMDPLPDMRHLDRLKVDRSRGYNLLARQRH